LILGREKAWVGFELLLERRGRRRIQRDDGILSELLGREVLVLRRGWKEEERRERGPWMGLGLVRRRGLRGRVERRWNE